MPLNPTKEQKAKWHIEHLEFCDCRRPSPKLMKEIKDYNILHKH